MAISMPMTVSFILDRPDQGRLQSTPPLWHRDAMAARTLTVTLAGKRRPVAGGRRPYHLIKSVRESSRHWVSALS
ncbi:hypothetical protein CBM2604_U10072 [Cupriavidus taiwanensis]|nr:hypothetical protein CBM2604_U10072 [Cupriavidus taiwanensis]